MRQISEEEALRILSILDELKEIFDAESVGLKQTRLGYSTTNDFEIEINCSHKEF